MRGLYTAGVIDVLMENEIYADSAVGVSAGAVFGCNYKSRQIGRVLRYNKKYCKDKRLASIRNWITTGDVYSRESDIMNCPGSWIFLTVRPTQKIPWNLQWCVRTWIQENRCIMNVPTEMWRILNWMRAFCIDPDSLPTGEAWGKETSGRWCVWSDPG